MSAFTPRLADRSFRGWLLSGAVALVGSVALAVGGLVFVQGGVAVRGLSRTDLATRLDRLHYRVEQLLAAAELTLTSGARLTAVSGPRDEAAWAALFAQVQSAFEQRPELTYLAFSSARTGEHGLLWRTAEGAVLWRQQERLDEGGGRWHERVREGLAFRPLRAGLAPWRDARERESYRRAVVAGGLVWAELVTPEETLGVGNEPAVLVSLPVYSPTGDVEGVWEAAFDRPALVAFMGSLERETGLHALLLGRLGVGGRGVIATSGETVVPLVAKRYLERWTGDAQPDESLFEVEQVNGTWLADGRQVRAPRPQWWVVGALPPSELATAFREARFWFLLIAGGALVAGIYGALLLARRLARPVEALRTAVEALAAGREAGPLLVEGRTAGELRALAAAFTRMHEAVTSRQRALASANAALGLEMRQRAEGEARLQAVLDHLPFELWVTDGGLRFTLLNTRALNRPGVRVGGTSAEAEAWLPRLESLHREALTGRVMTAELACGEERFDVLAAPVRVAGHIAGVLGVALDVTTQRRAEEALRASQRRLSLHLENTPLAVIDWSTDWQVCGWNTSAEAIFGWAARDVLGRSWEYLTAPEDIEGMGEALTGAAACVGTRHFRRNRTADGRTIDCEWYDTRLVDHDGQCLGTCSLVLDVTERLAAERLFRESEERFQKAFARAPIPQVIVRVRGWGILDVNDRWVATFGHMREAVVSRTLVELGCWSDASAQARFFSRLDLTGELFDHPETVYTAAGKGCPMLVSGTLVMLGTEPCILLSMSDVSELKAAGDALQESRRVLATLINQLPGMVYRCNNDERRTLLFLSRGAETITGYGPPELESGRVKFLNELVHPDDRARVERTVREAAGRVFEVEYRIHRRDGVVRWVWERGEALGGGGADGVLIGVLLDVTDRRLAEDAVRTLAGTLERRVAERTAQLAAANAKLKELDRLKSEFLATMSHELRTPLNSILGFSAVLKDGLAGPMNSEQVRQLEMVHGAAQHLLSLINDLLDLSRIASGRMELRVEELDVGGLLVEVERTVAPLVAARRLVYRTEVAADVATLTTDRKRLYQVVLNLVGNAIKFTEHGSVTVVATRLGDGVRIEVRDTGIGIQEEHLPLLFQAFRQIDGSSRRVYEGTGLGLHLVERLLSLLGGAITVASVFGEGSSFTITLPGRPPQPTLSESELPFGP